MPIPFLPPNDDTSVFPPVDQALEMPNGLLMAGANLRPERLISAYRHGIFPWYEEGEPILWWSPDPRCVIWPQNLKISRSLKKVLKQDTFEITTNVAFREVIKHCGGPRPGSSGTWITQSMMDAYCHLARYHFAQSTEVWLDGKLVGGLYGIALGKVFVGESMFSTVSNASKAALVHLTQEQGYNLIDCQLETDHLLSMGASLISRKDYIGYLQQWGEPDANLLLAGSLPAVRS